MSRALATIRRSAGAPEAAVSQSSVDRMADQIAEMSTAIVDLVVLLERGAQGSAPAAGATQAPTPAPAPIVVSATPSARAGQGPSDASIGATWTVELDKARGTMEVRRTDQAGGAVWHVQTDRSNPGKTLMQVRRAA